MDVSENLLSLAYLCLVTFCLGTLGFLFLTFVNNSKIRFLRKIFTISARKSVSDAIQLGGLPLAFSVLSGLLLASFFFSEPFASEKEFKVLTYWMFASLVVVAYGHLDDKFELRPIVKLCMQVGAVGLFSLPSSVIFYPEWSALSFLWFSFWGMTALNGGNLLDGLDTLTIKLSSVALLAFMYLGYEFNSSAVFVCASVALSGVWSFYYFNKEPAKVHLGEIGGSFIGFFLLLCSGLLFLKMEGHEAGSIKTLRSIAIASLPLSLPFVELSVSFSRRIYNRKSPFRGDKYHLHHILRNYYNFSPSLSSTIYAGSYGLIAMVSLMMLPVLPHAFPFFFMNGFMIVSYIFVGKKHWASDNHLDLKPTALFDYLRKKDVAVINSLEFDEFKIEIITEFEERELDDSDTLHDEDVEDKKAA